MALTFTVLAIIATVVALGAYWSFSVIKDAPAITRILFCISSLGMAGIVLRVLGLTAASPVREWNGARLAPLVAFARGIPLYGDPRTGILSAWIYGPVAVAAYLPASLSHNPTNCILLGVTLSELMVLGPAIWGLSLACRRIGTHWRTMGPLLAAIFIGVVARSQSLIDGSFFVLSDAPALALVISACLVLVPSRSPRAAAVSALLTVLACWCKQTVLPFAIVPGIFLLALRERKALLAYALGLVVAGTVISTLFLSAFGVRAMWFNMITVPAHQPLRYGGDSLPLALCRGLYAWMGQAALPAMPLAGALVIAIVIRKGVDQSPGARDRIGEFCRRRPWIVLLLASASLLIPSVVGFIKVSGDLNNFALSELPLLLAGCMGVIDLWHDLSAIRPSLANLFAWAGFAIVLLLGVTADATQPGAIRGIGEAISAPENNREEIVFNFEQQHPGVAYFPWEPLPVFLADAKLYHFEWGFMDRVEAGLPPSREQAMAHVPTSMQFIAIPDGATSCALQFLPAPGNPFRLPELPGFLVFAVEKPVSSRGTALNN